MTIFNSGVDAEGIAIAHWNKIPNELKMQKKKPGLTRHSDDLVRAHTGYRQGSDQTAPVCLCDKWSTKSWDTPLKKNTNKPGVKFRNTPLIYKQVIGLDVRLSDLWIMSWAIWPWIQDLDVSNLFVKTLDKTFFARILCDSRQIF